MRWRFLVPILLAGAAHGATCVTNAVSAAFEYVATGLAVTAASSPGFGCALPGERVAAASSASFDFAVPGSALASASSVSACYYPAGTALTSASSAPFAFGEDPSLGAVRFATNAVSVVEGESLTLDVFGGSETAEVSVVVFLSFGSASSADLDLKGGSLDGIAAKAGLRFPLTLTWVSGDLAPKTIVIPVKADKAVEDDETLVFQLADVRGADLGRGAVCRVLIRDANVARDYAVKQSKMTTRTKKGVADSFVLKTACVASDGSEDLGGYTTGQGTYYSGCTATVGATARPGWTFKGWGEVSDGVTNLVSATKSKSVKMTNNVELVAFFARIPRVTGLAVPANAGIVSGGGYCGAGMKATLKATANKGFAFVGWWPSEAVDCAEAVARSWPVGDPVSRSSSITLENSTDNRTLSAWFVTAGEDRASIAASVDGMWLLSAGGEAPVSRCTTNVWAGVRLEWPVVAYAHSGTKVSVTGLPGGLSFASNTISGAPTAASKTKKAKDGTVSVVPSVVKVTIMTGGGNVLTYPIDLTVDPLPTWAVGTFAGPSYEDGRDVVTNGMVTVTTTASGKVTAKQPVGGKTTGFSAKWFDRYDPDGGAFFATLTAKIGKTVLTNEMIVSSQPGRDDLVPVMGVLEADLFDAWQYGWSVEPWKTVGKAFDKKTLTYAVLADGRCSEREEDVAAALSEDVVAKVTLKFASTGAVTVSGEFVSGYDKKKSKYTTVKSSASTKVLPIVGEDGTYRYSVFVSLSPKGLPTHTRCVTVAL